MELIAVVEGIILRSIPTFIVVWILYAFTNRFFYRPLRKALQEREEATSGLRQRANAQIATAEAKAAEYEEALRAARARLYHEQEQERQKALEYRAEILKRARQAAEQKIAAAKRQIAAEVQESRAALERQSNEMASWITRVILQGEPEAKAVNSEVAT